MTCIVGLVENKCVYIGADSAGATSYQITIHRDPKVFRAGDFLFGCATSFRLIQLLHYALVPPPYVPPIEVERYLIVDFIDALRTCLKEGGFAKREDEKEVGGTCLLGFQGRLFLIDSDYQVSESQDDYAAIGVADDVALGVLYATKDMGMPPKQRLNLALAASAHHNTDVRPPFIIEYLEKEQ